MTSSLVVKSKLEADYITSGTCGQGEKLPTIRELAKKYSVGYVTVIEAVKILAQEGKVVKKQGSGVYVSPVPNRSAGHSIAKRIGYITNCFSQKDAFGYNILAGIERLAYLSGYKLEIANSNYDYVKEKEIVTEMVNNGVDGIILYPVPDRTREHEYLANEFLEVPIVAVDLAQPEMQRPCVVFDNHNAGYEMAKYLIKKGCSKIIFLHHLSDNKSIRDRVSGSKRAAELELSPFGNKFDFSVETWEGEGTKYLYDKLKMLMDSKNAPDAIISGTDFGAADVYFWLTSNGFKVPSEIEVVGFDNIIPDFVPWHDLSDGYQYHWPTTDPDFTRLGERAFDLLLETMKANCSIPREIVLPCPVLVKRNNYKKNITGIRIKAIG